MTSFSDNFWGEPPTAGFNVLAQNFKIEMPRSVEEFMIFLKESYKVEEAYAKGLFVVAQKVGGFSQNGSIAPMWVVIKQWVEKVANFHQKLVREYQDLLRNAHQYLDAHKEKQRSMKDRLVSTQDAVMLMQQMPSTVNSRKQVYHDRSVEHEKLKLQQNAKESEKVKVKMEKAHEDYKLILEKYATARDDYEQKMKDSCLAFEEVERSHIDQMKTFLVEYSDILDESHKLVGDAHQEFRTSYEAETVDIVLDKYVCSKATGVAKPAPIELEEPDLTQVMIELANPVNDPTGKGDASVWNQAITLMKPWRRTKRSKKNALRSAASLDNLDQEDDEVDDEGYRRQPEHPGFATDSRREKTSSDSSSDDEDDNDLWHAPKFQIRENKSVPIPDKGDEETSKIIKDKMNQMKLASNSDLQKTRARARAARELNRTVTVDQTSSGNLVDLPLPSSTSAVELGQNQREHQQQNSLQHLFDFSPGFDQTESDHNNIVPLGVLSANDPFVVRSMMAPVVPERIQQSATPTPAPPLPLPEKVRDEEDTTNQNQPSSPVIATKPAPAAAVPLSPPLPSCNPPALPPPAKIPILPNLPSAGPAAAAKLRRSVTPRLNIPSPNFDLSTNTWGFGSSRGPSPIGDTIIPIALAFTEVCHARFIGADTSNHMARLEGNLIVSFPAGIIRVLSDTTHPPPQLVFKLTNAKKVSNLAVNRNLLAQDHSQTTDEMLAFGFDMQDLAEHLKRQVERSRTAPFFNVDILKYAVKLSHDNQSENVPLKLTSYWKCDLSQTQYRLDYDYNGSCLLPPVQLTNLVFKVTLGKKSKHVKSLPEAEVQQKDAQTVCTWRMNSLADGVSDACLRATFVLDEGVSSGPGRTDVQFTAEGTTTSGVEFQLAGPGYRLSLVKKRVSAGTFYAEADEVCYV